MKPLIAAIPLMFILACTSIGQVQSAADAMKPSPAYQAAPPSPTPDAVKPSAGGSVDELQKIATSSACQKYSFADQGQPRSGWLKGMVTVYARALCNPDRPDVKLLKASPGPNDALSYYGIQGEPMKATFALMVGLAARESSWKYCCGRDSSGPFSSADSAEAGFLQTSYGARAGSGGVLRAGGEIDRVYRRWKSADKSKCLLETFKQSVSDSYCSGWNAKNWGDPSSEGYQWQALTKSCPAFAAEYGALVMRFNGGAKGEFGPIRTKKAQYRQECFDMLSAVEKYVIAHPAVCASL